MTSILYIDNDNLVTVSALKNQRTGAYIATATLSASLLDSDDNPVAGQAWPVDGDYLAGTDGNYVIPLSDALELAENEFYTLVITVVSADLQAVWRIPAKAVYREHSC